MKPPRLTRDGKGRYTAEEERFLAENPHLQDPDDGDRSWYLHDRSTGEIYGPYDYLLECRVRIREILLGA